MTLAEDSDVEKCGGPENGALQTAQCLDAIAQQKYKLVDQLYQEALIKRRSYHMPDDRSGSAQLEKEHAAWKAYTTEHCTFEAGVMEGASIWISLSEVRCEVRALDARISYFQEFDMRSGG
jgi:hypothetical protein